MQAAVPVLRQFRRDCAFVFVIGLIGLWVGSGWQLQTRVIPQLQTELEHQAALGAFSAGPAVDKQQVCEDIASRTHARVTWLSSEAEVLGDSDFGPSSALPLAHYPELKTAIDGGIGHAVRTDSSTGTQQLFVAIPIESDGQILRLARPLPTRLSVIGQHAPLVITGAIFLLVLIGIRVRRLTNLQSAAASLADALESDRHDRLPRSDIQEMDHVSLAANKVIKRLRKMDAVAERKTLEWEAVFRGMQEGILLTDDSDELRMLNPAAAAFFDIPDPAEAVGKLYLEVIRNADLYERVEALRRGEADNQRMDLHFAVGAQERGVLVSGTRIRYPNGHRDAVLLVMSDITQLEKLQRMREQFAGNVSHELKTPLTSMSGYIELLADSASDDNQPLIATVSRQCERLQAIIDDLLYLSRIEHHDPDLEDDFADVSLSPLLERCVDARKADAAARKLSLELQAEDTSIFANDRLLEHALDNLIANALRHSPDGATVTISAASNEQHLRLEVADSGPGIAAEYHRRIFQRFFRIDKGRDRDSGGTGLGLAIVKHVVYLHRGRVWVESEPGSGSRFIIELPQKCL